MHYDGKKILFSYRKGGTENYLLYEIDVDGSNLRQITRGKFDDIEPTYLPNGDILFISSRCKRWVNCWLTQVATMYRCDAEGKNIRLETQGNPFEGDGKYKLLVFDGDILVGANLINCMEDAGIIKHAITMGRPLSMAETTALPRYLQAIAV